MTAQNVIPNPDFDLGAAGWSGGSLVANDGLPSAPSYLVISSVYNQFEAHSDCFPVDATRRYMLRGRMRIMSGSVGIVLLHAYSNAGCAGSYGAAAHLANSFGDGSWVELSYNHSSFQLPSDAVSARITLVANSGVSAPGHVRFDSLELEVDDVFAGSFDGKAETY